MEVNKVFTQEMKDKILSEPLFKGKIVSDSMEPVLKVGDLIVVDVKAAHLKRFDIIVFLTNGRLICHYLWQRNQVVRPILMQTRSLNGSIDYPIGEDDYIGKVISHKLSLWWKIRILVGL